MDGAHNGTYTPPKTKKNHSYGENKIMREKEIEGWIYKERERERKRERLAEREREIDR